MKRKLFSLAAASMIVLGSASVAEADFLAIAGPSSTLPGGQEYASGTTLMAVPGEQYDVITALPAEGVTFSSAMTILDAPDGWATWSGPPDTEAGSPRVLYSDGLTQVTLSFGRAFAVFGFELQPNQYGPFTFTATFFNGVDEVGRVARDVSGDAGALLFAAASTGSTPAFTSVRISGSQDFGIARLRYAPAQAVPEPGSLTLIAVAAALLAAVARAGRRPMPDHFPSEA